VERRNLSGLNYSSISLQRANVKQWVWLL